MNIRRRALIGSLQPIRHAIATVSGLGSSDPANVTFTKDAGFTVAGIDITEWTDDIGNVFIKIPTLYRKVNDIVDNQITSFTISTALIDNTYLPYSVFIDENGNLLDYVCIGKYWNTSSTSMISSDVGVASLSITNARTRARNVGMGYQSYDWQFHKLWQDLIIIFKETINTNTGTSWTYDEMGIYWSSYNFWIDGLWHDHSIIIVSDKPSKYIDNATTSSDGYFGVSYNFASTGGEVQSLGYDSSHPFVSLPSTVTSNSSYNTFYCDQYVYSPNVGAAFSIVGGSSASDGPFFLSFPYFPLPLACRLCYRPIS